MAVNVGDCVKRNRIWRLETDRLSTCERKKYQSSQNRKTPLLIHKTPTKNVKLYNIYQPNEDKIFLAACRMYLVKAGQRLEVVVLAEVQHECEQAEDLSVEAELQEEPVVVLSNAVVDPGGEGTTAFKTHTLQKKTCVKDIGCLAESAVSALACSSLTRDSGGPSCARSGRIGCSGGSVWAA